MFFILRYNNINKEFYLKKTFESEDLIWKYIDALFKRRLVHGPWGKKSKDYTKRLVEGCGGVVTFTTYDDNGNVNAEERVKYYAVHIPNYLNHFTDRQSKSGNIELHEAVSKYIRKIQLDTLLKNGA